MKRTALIVLSLICFVWQGSLAQGWYSPTPRQTIAIHPDGSRDTFFAVDLIAGMKYHAHAEGRFQASNNGDICDARYYVGLLGPVASGSLINVGLKYRQGSGGEDWFNNAQPTQAYQGSHIYDASIPSTGAGPISMRVFDRNEPPDAYYTDNSGDITVEVVRETPGIAVWRDTLRFPPTRAGSSVTLPDSIWGYGYYGYQLESTSITGPGAAVFSVVSERTVPFGLKDQTNEFKVTFKPTSIGNFTASFHLHSSTAFGADQDRIIYLTGDGAQASITLTPDTLKFGTLSVNQSKTLPLTILNSGNVSVVATGVTMTPSTMPYTVSGLPAAVAAAGQAFINVAFTPAATGNYEAKFDLAFDDGSTKTFYATGAAGIGVPNFDTGDTLDFGKVVIGLSNTLQSTFRNRGTADLYMTSGVISSAIANEYTVIGNTGPYKYTPGGGEVYNFTFSPTIHITGTHSGNFTVSFTDQGPKTIYFIGTDHERQQAILSISPNYYTHAGNEITISQYLQSDLSGTITPIKTLDEVITYDATLFDFVRAERGSLIAGSGWNFAATPTLGQIAISISNTGSGFTNGGELVRITFKVHLNAPVDSYTDLVQTGINFSNSIEPVAIPQNGRIVISDVCTPVRLKQGIAASYIDKAYPSPASSLVRIGYSVGESSEEMQTVTLRIYDEMGHYVRTLINEKKASGIYTFFFNAGDYPNGTYTYTYQVGDYFQSQRMVILK
jgi:5-hydroxyisourate hydrolase-like protein (transthyretin family)